MTSTPRRRPVSGSRSTSGSGFVRDQVTNAQRALRAIDDLFDRAGARAISTSNPMQRLFRDAHAARHHSALTPLEPSLFGYVHNTMGLGPTGDPLA